MLLIVAVLGGASALHAQERFTTQETVVSTKPKTAASSASGPSAPSSKAVRLRVGEIVQVFEFRDKFGVPRESFYVPAEGTRVVQVVMERTGNTDRYYLKGRSKGRTAGGIVLREWLDSTGFKPRSIADELRIQAAVKANPVYINVE